MASFTGDFSITQNTESQFTLQDTSVGAAPTITSRTVNFRTFDNQLFAASPYTWNIDDPSISFDILNKDYGLNVTVDWNAPTPDPANTYTKTEQVGFDYYNLIFLGQLIAERMARYPSIVNDTNFMNNWFELYAYIACARISTGLMNDIVKTQISLDLATYRRLNQNLYF